MAYGTLHGVGVGPGDPELLTLKAVRVLASVDVIFAASSTKNGHSLAQTIVAPHLKNGTRVVRLGFPMCHDREELERAWAANAFRMLEELEQGRDAAFITLGDPLTFSTFGYLLRTLREMAPELPVRIVPGVSSIQAAAATAGTVLGEREQCIAIVSGAHGGEHLARAAQYADSLVVLKVYKQFDHIRETLRGLGLDKGAVLLSNCGQEGEQVVRDINAVDAQPGYFSMILAKKP
jgi:precorrin-2/cobalt-factor-2 C20-methyltransferase